MHLFKHSYSREIHLHGDKRERPREVKIYTWSGRHCVAWKVNLTQGTPDSFDDSLQAFVDWPQSFFYLLSIQHLGLVDLPVLFLSFVVVFWKTMHSRVYSCTLVSIAPTILFPKNYWRQVAVKLSLLCVLINTYTCFRLSYKCDCQ